MNNMILVKVPVHDSMCAGGGSLIRGQYEALTAAISKLDRLPFFSDCDADLFDLQYALTMHNGNKVQACRALDFETFTDEDDLPVAILFDTYFDSSALEEYNVDWGSVVDNEIRKAQKEDAALDNFRVWFVAVYIELG
jgi:hypothetical protein